MLDHATLRHDLILKPTNCLIAFTIPLTQEQFFSQRDDAEKDFVRNCCSNWAKYQFEIIKTIDNVVPQYEQLGVRVLNRFNVDNITPCFKPGFKHFILVAHWLNNKVEFYDRMANFEEVAELIPEEFDGIIDLCVCTPIELVTRIKQIRPNSSVRFNQTPSSLIYWLYYYLIFFKYIAVNDVSFNKAFECVTKELLKQL